MIILSTAMQRNARRPVIFYFMLYFLIVGGRLVSCVSMYCFFWPFIICKIFLCLDVFIISFVLTGLAY